MGARIDELEQSINDLKAEMGNEGMATPSKIKEESKPSDSSAWVQQKQHDSFETSLLYLGRSSLTNIPCYEVSFEQRL